jgi:hypothetical protein
MRCGVLHRWLFVWSLTALLYGGAAAFASEGQPGAANAALRPDVPIATPIEPAVAHIALLLPGSANAFTRAAEAVKLGINNAAKIQGSVPLPIRVYDVAGDAASITADYRRALAAGARLVIGPLTRDGVTALTSSGSIAVPTLALNVPDGTLRLPPNLYVLSLHVEAEARQVARLATEEGPPQCVHGLRRHTLAPPRPPGFQSGIHTPWRQHRCGIRFHLRDRRAGPHPAGVAARHG